MGTVSVAVDITHPFRSDLKIDLVAPSGVATTLYDGVRDGINPEANIVGELPITTALQGQAAKGTWQLRVGDYEKEDTGTLNPWNLTITPASETQEPETPAHIFLETFQEGLGAWRAGSGWEVRSLGSQATIPGEGAGNIVARAQGCPFCFLTLTEPVDLSAYESVTLSFYRWMDAGTSDNEFLGIDIGNNGAYRRLNNWDKQHADGQWHYRTVTLTKDQISDAFTIRFFAIARNAFTTFAVDNVMIAAAPSSVVVEPVEEEPEEEQEPEQPKEETEEETEEEEEEEEPTSSLDDFFSFFDIPGSDESTDKPDLAVTNTVAFPTSLQSGNTLIVSARITNNGTASSTSKTVRVYRHTTATQTPRIGGTQAATTVTVTLAVDAARTTTVNITAPFVSETTDHYYLCVDTTSGEQNTADNCSQTPVTVTVQPNPDQPEPEESTTRPDLAVTETTARPLSLQSGDTVTISATITNTGTAPATSRTVSIHRHTTKTNNPQRGGTKETNTATTGTLALNAAVSVTSTHTAPSVTNTTRYYYYLCVDADTTEQTTNNNCSDTPAEVVVRTVPDDPRPPYKSCFDVPERSTPMGGDAL